MRQPSNGFSLIELLVVLAIIAVLATLAATGVSTSMANAESGACKSNLRQIHLANQLFAGDHQEHFVAAASDLMGNNLKRWHGERDSRRDAFDARRGPLTSYLGDADEVRRCASLKDVVTQAKANAFEASCGGYGYNAIGIGSESYVSGYNKESAQKGIRTGLLQHPADTIMFADTAFPQPYRNPDYLIEYSFVEPVFFLGWNSTEPSGRRASASIHFRHRRQTAQIAWADGHIDAAPMGLADEDTFDIGWPGEENNDLYAP